MARKGRDRGPHGLLVVDKPVGPTSHDVVAQARRHLGQRRIGHSGTLDPPASGVLLLGVGRLTRALRWLTALPKSYEGELVLGTATSTLDDTGEVTERASAEHVTLDGLRAAAAEHLTGSILQVPPMVSAVRVDGKRLHELAREGVEVEREPRAVTVHRFSVDGDPATGAVHLSVDCSSGTYVRSLADDLARAVGTVGHLRGLRRTAIGSWTEAEAAPVEEAELVAPAAALRDLVRIDVDDATADRVRHGAVLDLAVDPTADAVAVVGPGEELLAVYEPHRGRWKPAAVLAG